MFLVAGGDIVSVGYGSSTEILPTGSSTWFMAASLPDKISSVASVSLGGDIYITGQYMIERGGLQIVIRPLVGGVGLFEYPTDDVLVWRQETWEKVGKMKRPRASHAISTIFMEEDAMRFCE